MLEAHLNTPPVRRWIAWGCLGLMVASCGCSQWRPVDLTRSWAADSSDQAADSNRQPSARSQPTSVANAEFQPEQDSQARILGIYQSEESPEITLQAVPHSTAGKPKLAPVPEALLAGLDIEDPVATNAQPPSSANGQCPHGGDCDCQKKKVVPKLADVKPLDPKTLFPDPVSPAARSTKAATQPIATAAQPTSKATPEQVSAKETGSPAPAFASEVAATSVTWPSPAPLFESEPGTWSEPVASESPTDVAATTETKTQVVPGGAEASPAAEQTPDPSPAVQPRSGSLPLEIRVAEVCLHCRSIACSGECQNKATLPSAAPLAQVESAAKQEEQTPATQEPPTIARTGHHEELTEEQPMATADLDIPFDPEAFAPPIGESEFLSTSMNDAANPGDDDNGFEAISADNPNADAPMLENPNIETPEPPVTDPNVEPEIPADGTSAPVCDFENEFQPFTPPTTEGQLPTPEFDPIDARPVPTPSPDEFSPFQPEPLLPPPTDNMLDAPTPVSTPVQPEAETTASGLQLGNPALCTRIWGFGQFQRCASNAFNGTGQMLVYCEVENQTSVLSASDQQHHTRLQGRITIHDVNGRLVQEIPFPPIEDRAANQRNEFYVYFPVRLKSLTDGDYEMTVTLSDLQAAESAKPQVTLSLQVRN